MEGQGGGVDLAFIRRYGRRVSFVRLFKRVIDRFSLSVCLFGIMSRISTSTYLDTFSQPVQETGKARPPPPPPPTNLHTYIQARSTHSF